MFDDPTSVSAAPTEAALLERLRQAWHGSGVGCVDGDVGYAQWAKYPEGLQLEVGSNACAPEDGGLNFSTRRRLEILGFTRPGQSQPNYHRRFLTYDSLQEAARVLASVLSPPAQSFGHVMVIVPVGKVRPDVLGELTRRVFWALRDRASVTMIDAYGVDRRPEQTSEPLDEYLGRLVPEPCDRATVLTAALPVAERAQWRAHGETIVTAAQRLRAEGRHVLVVGPYFLPGDEAAWLDLLRQCADGVLLVGRHDELATYMAQAVAAVEQAAPPDVVEVMGYRDPNASGGSRAVPAHHLDLGVLEFPAHDLAWMSAGVARVMGMPWLGGGAGRRVGPPLPWPTPGKTRSNEHAASSMLEAPAGAQGAGGLAAQLALDDAEAAHAWRPMVDGSQLCAVCDSLRDEPPHAGASAGPDDLARPFARAIDAKRQLLHLALSPRQRAAVLASMSVDIRKYCDVASPRFLVPRVSAASAAAASRLGVDLCQQVWQDQHAFDPGRTVFHLEHVVPVQSLRTSCLSAADVDGVLRVLQAAQVAWILKSEDRELTRLGFRARRSSPEQAYEAAGIELLDCLHR